MPRNDSQNVINARRVLRGAQWSPDELRALYKSLKRSNKFSYARKILRILREKHHLYNDKLLCQQHALCTYKDNDLPGEIRYDQAIQILKSSIDIENTKCQETLGILGAIYKRKWEFDNQNTNLERSLIYYRRGCHIWYQLIELKRDDDNGYTAINTAYVLDLLAFLEINEAQAVNAEAGFALDKRQEAETIRRTIIEELTPRAKNSPDYWMLSTLAEAHFGLNEFDVAVTYLNQAKNLAGSEWEFESTSKQLASLAQIQIAMFNDYGYALQLLELNQIDETEGDKKSQLLQLLNDSLETLSLHDLNRLAEQIPLHLADEKVNLESIQKITTQFQKTLGDVNNLEFPLRSNLKAIDGQPNFHERVENSLNRIDTIICGEESLIFKKGELIKEADLLSFLIIEGGEIADERTTIKKVAEQIQKVVPNHGAQDDAGVLLEHLSNNYPPQYIHFLAIKLIHSVQDQLHYYALENLARQVLSRRSDDQTSLDGLRVIAKEIQQNHLYFSDRDEASFFAAFIDLVVKAFSDNIYTKEEQDRIRPFAKKVLIELASNVLEDQARFALKDFLGDVVAVDTAFTGKVGLALSGGGFRASLYHIGVLAKLAELDILRHVEVLSCVSGGSIIGAYYYLKIKHLLETKKDEEIIRDDYIQLVKEVEKEFLAAVQQNIRMRVFLNPWYNIQMLFVPSKTRSSRLAGLYEDYFYKPLIARSEKEKEELYVKLGLGKIAEEDRMVMKKLDKIPMDRLRINPLMISEADELTDSVASFHYKRDNWRRRNKIPNLILNATSLNTGHNWQFTASWMGEPPASIVGEIDAKFRLRRMYYYEAPEDYKYISLGEAVAASSGVPGLFEPLELKELYDDIVVQLVDGGVHDNQGVVGLLEQECKLFFVSDSSGQVVSQELSGSDTFEVVMRTNEILQGRIRESQYLNLRSRRRSALIREMLFIHLKKDLGEAPKNWKFCEDPAEFTKTAKSADTQEDLTEYDIRTEVQSRLATVRTDLDTFNDAEAYALMYSGYKMTGYEHNHSTKSYFNEHYPLEAGWRFLSIAEYTYRPHKSKDLQRLLDVSANLPFKVFRMSRTWQVIGYTICTILAIAGAVFVVFSWHREINIPLKRVYIWIVLFLMPLVVGKLITWYRDYKGSIRSLILKINVAAIGALVAWLSVGWFNRIYLRQGRLPLRYNDNQANLFLGILGMIAGGSIFYFKDWIAQKIDAQYTNLELPALEMAFITKVVSIGLVIAGVIFISYFCYSLFSRKSKTT